eukprot:277880-Amorphochlora_amoeboformis.AAC.2
MSAPNVRPPKRCIPCGLFNSYPIGMILNAVAGCGDCPTGGSGAWELVKFLTDLLNRAGIPPPNSGVRGREDIFEY